MQRLFPRTTAMLILPVLKLFLSLFVFPSLSVTSEPASNSALSITQALSPGTPISGSGIQRRADSSANFGNFYNYWAKEANGWDLTRGNKTNAITLPVPGGPITINPETSALVIIDMQNFFLHPELGGDPKGRDVVNTTIDMIHAFRASGMKVFWTNWGLTEFDLINMPPAFIRGFSSDGTAATSFGSDMGTISVPSTTGTGNTSIQVGRKLMRGSWNAEPWGPLLQEQVEGVANGTDFYFNKNRLSGLWGRMTPLEQFLEDSSMTTLFFGGVNIDQCVWGTLLDAYYKGYDVILVDDIAATTSPLYATQMTDYNVKLDGWGANSTDIIPTLKQLK